MGKFLQFIAVTSMAFMISGCATIVSGTTQKVDVTSQPSDATAKVAGGMNSTTPTTFILERKKDHVIEISKEGYKTTVVYIKRMINGMVAGNILIGGLIGTGVDMASGANNKLVPEKVNVILEPGEGVSEKPKFLSEAEQDYYEKHVLNPMKEKEEKEREKQEKAAQAGSSDNGASSNFVAKDVAANQGE